MPVCLCVCVLLTRFCCSCAPPFAPTAPLLGFARGRVAQGRAAHPAHPPTLPQLPPPENEPDFLPVEEEPEVVEGAPLPEGVKKSKRVDPALRTTTMYMTKYERARILGTRALQLSMNAPPMVNVGDETDPLKIAMMELKEHKMCVGTNPGGWGVGGVGLCEGCCRGV